MYARKRDKDNDGKQVKKSQNDPVKFTMRKLREIDEGKKL